MAVGRPRLVVLRALGLGDLLTAVPALRALARHFPEHRRALVAPGPLTPLVALVDGADGGPAVHEVVDHHGLAPLPERLRGAAVAVNLHGRGTQSHVALRAVAPERLIAFAARGHADGPAWWPGEHEVDRWCRLLQEHGIPADPVALGLRAPALAPADARGRGATLIHPGAAAPARRWPAPRWAAVARAERAAGREVLITGGPAERQLAVSVAEQAGLAPGAVLAGETDLLRLAAFVGAAGRLACGDTGVAHLATAFGTPSVTLFGPVAPSAWGPYPAPAARRVRHAALWAAGADDPPGDPHAVRCDPVLARLGVADVVAALAALPTAA